MHTVAGNGTVTPTSGLGCAGVVWAGWLDACGVVWGFDGVLAVLRLFDLDGLLCAEGRLTKGWAVFLVLAPPLAKEPFVESGDLAAEVRFACRACSGVNGGVRITNVGPVRVRS